MTQKTSNMLNKTRNIRLFDIQKLFREKILKH